MNMAVARRRAEALVSACRMERPAVDVEEIAQRLGARVVRMDLEDASGLLISRPGSPPCIVVNRDHHPVRQRFTIGHEIGHLHLRHQFQTGAEVHVDRHVVSFRDSRSETGTDALEIEANQFASALLMPTAMVRREVGKLQGLVDEQLEDLARLFQVSVQAMTIRLNKLKLL